MLEITEELRAKLAELYLTAHHLLRDMQELGRQREAILAEVEKLIREAGHDPTEIEPVFNGYHLEGLRKKTQEGGEK